MSNKKSLVVDFTFKPCYHQVCDSDWILVDRKTSSTDGLSLIIVFSCARDNNNNLRNVI